MRHATGNRPSCIRSPTALGPSACARPGLRLPRHLTPRQQHARQVTQAGPSTVWGSLGQAECLAARPLLVQERAGRRTPRRRRIRSDLTGAEVRQVIGGTRLPASVGGFASPTGPLARYQLVREGIAAHPRTLRQCRGTYERGAADQYGHGTQRGQTLLHDVLSLRAGQITTLVRHRRAFQGPSPLVSRARPMPRWAR